MGSGRVERSSEWMRERPEVVRAVRAVEIGTTMGREEEDISCGKCGGEGRGKGRISFELGG